MNNKKYELTKESKIVEGVKVFRIKALKDLDNVKSNVKKGDFGGYVQSSNNLSQEGFCWIYDNAVASGNSCVREDAEVKGQGYVKDNADISCCAVVTGIVRNNARVSGGATVEGIVEDDAIITYLDSVPKGSCVSGQSQQPHVSEIPQPSFKNDREI